MYFCDRRPSYYEYALLSSHVYQDHEDSDIWSTLQQNGWEIYGFRKSPSSGYFGRIFKNESTKNIVVAHRGTDNFKSALEDLNSIVCGGSGQQRNDVYTIIETAFQLLFEDNQFHHLSFTGHSLGAFLADMSVLMAKRKRLEGNYAERQKVVHFSAVTFESPGCITAWEQMQPNLPINRIKWEVCDIINFMSFPNAINAFDKPIGTVYLIPIDLNVNKQERRNWWDLFAKSKDLVKTVIYKNYTLKCHSMANIFDWFKRFEEDLNFGGQPQWMIDFPTGFTGHKFFKKLVTFKENGEIVLEELQHSEESSYADNDKEYKDLFSNHFRKAPYDFHRNLPLRHFPFQKAVEIFHDKRKCSPVPSTNKMSKYTDIKISSVYEGDQKIVQFATKDVLLFRRAFSEWLMELQGEGDGINVCSKIGIALTKSYPDIGIGKWWLREVKLINSFYPRKHHGELIVHKLNEFLVQTPSSKAVICRQVTVHGFGGVGKTSMAKWYAVYFQEFYDHIIWIDCGEQMLSRSVEKLATDLGIDNIEKYDSPELAEKCFVKLTRKKCLFIYDNAECYVGRNGIRDVLPNDDSNFHCLITSRNTHWGAETMYGKIHTFTLDVFTPYEAEAFLERHLKLPYHNYEIKKLAEVLGYLPLALQIAIAACNEKRNNLTMALYIETIGRIIHSVTTLDDYGDKSIFASMKITLDLIEKFENGAIALQILKYFAYIQPNDVKVDFFRTIENADVGEIEAGVDLLAKYSLVNTGFVQETVIEYDDNIFTDYFELSKELSNLFSAEWELGEAMHRRFEHRFKFEHRFRTGEIEVFDKFGEMRYPSEIKVRELEKDFQTISTHRLLLQVVRSVNKSTETATLEKILACKGFIEYKLIPYAFAVELKNVDLVTKFEDIRSKIFSQFKLPELLRQRQYNGAVELSKIIYDKFKNDNKRLQLSSLYNYAVCLVSRNNINEALKIFQLLYPQLTTGSESAIRIRLDIISLFDEPQRLAVALWIIVLRFANSKQGARLKHPTQQLRSTKIQFTDESTFAEIHQIAISTIIPTDLQLNNFVLRFDDADEITAIDYNETFFSLIPIKELHLLHHIRSDNDETLTTVDCTKLQNTSVMLSNVKMRRGNDINELTKNLKLSNISSGSVETIYDVTLSKFRNLVKLTLADTGNTRNKFILNLSSIPETLQFLFLLNVATIFDERTTPFGKLKRLGLRSYTDDEVAAVREIVNAITAEMLILNLDYQKIDRFVTLSEILAIKELITSPKHSTTVFGGSNWKYHDFVGRMELIDEGDISDDCNDDRNDDCCYYKFEKLSKKLALISVDQVDQLCEWK